MKKKKETKKQRARRLLKNARERERRFKRATPDQQRVMIARDVLAALRTSRTAPVKLTPEMGTYLQTDIMNNTLSGRPVDKIVSAAPTCTACALGSMLICSLIRRGDQAFNRFIEGTQLEGHDDFSVWRRGDVTDGLEGFFSDEQLALIESAFEERQVSSLFSEEETAAAVRFGLEYDTAKDRLEAIMTNIIKNKGIFVP